MPLNVLRMSVSKPLASTTTVLPISLPVELYFSSNVDTLSALQTQLEHLSLPAQWFSTPASDSIHQLFKLNASAAQVSLSVQINSQLNWTVTVAGNNISADFFSQSEFDADTKLASSQQIVRLLSHLDKCQLCIGNTDEKFSEIIKQNDTTPGTYNFSLRH